MVALSPGKPPRYFARTVHGFGPAKHGVYYLSSDVIRPWAGESGPCTAESFPGRGSTRNQLAPCCLGGWPPLRPGAPPFVRLAGGLARVGDEPCTAWAGTRSSACSFSTAWLYASSAAAYRHDRDRVRRVGNVGGKCPASREKGSRPLDLRQGDCYIRVFL
jgi:hypothetical protein